MSPDLQTLAPGARILVRDAEWLVRKVDRTSTGDQAISAIGVSELVRDKEAVFLESVEPEIEVLRPEETDLVPDTSPGYRASLLHMESLLRRKPPTDDRIYVGHRGAMDQVDYQLEPAAQALEQPRQRILIADAVGLGKTLEAGILISELMRRGMGRRILVVALKSMLTQFQKELWSRFTIPLVRLDSLGIQRVRQRIPTNHNPFYYYDKAIVSIDTLKQDTEYRNYLEDAWWDIIVIDEAQNVAERGGSTSQRAKLAKLLSHRSDTLIMLSATPHDGRARSFASLMNMLDPTAISDPDDYTREEIEGLFIRRFKKDIADQVAGAFQTRTITQVHCSASQAEEEAYHALVETEFSRLDQRRGGAILFKTALEKALFSSPAACLQTVRNRIKRLQREKDATWRDDVKRLQEIEEKVEAITQVSFSRYQRLVEMLKGGIGWDPSAADDRMVIFTERIATLDFLHKHLMKDLGLKDKEVLQLHGQMSDIDQQAVVEAFGRRKSPVRLLIASDVASEGINLHYFSHRMIHFDIPWSLMVFKQRNGRIDRYGQKKKPEIYYLVTRSRHSRIRGDTRILELLIDKDEQAHRNIGDPASFMNVYDIPEEEKITARAIEEGMEAEDFDSQLDGNLRKDPLEILMGGSKQPTGQRAASRTASLPSLFSDCFEYLEAALEQISGDEDIQHRTYPDDRRIDLTAPADLRQRMRKQLPSEVIPNDNVLVLTEESQRIQRDIEECRSTEEAWPTLQYLWPLNPVLNWADDRLTAAFGRHQAPVLSLPGGLDRDEVVFLLSGLVPSRRGHPLVHRWFGTVFRAGEFSRIEPFPQLLERTRLHEKSYPNRGEPLPEGLQDMLADAVEWGRAHMQEKRREFQDRMDERIEQQLQRLDRLKQRRKSLIKDRYSGSRIPEAMRKGKEAHDIREVEKLFDSYFTWIRDSRTTEDTPWLQVIAVLRGTRQ